MKQEEMAAICPYTGLRSFTEDESIFFKGRDTHIEKITRLLEKNKFLMVTGASGEGKSSLVYAGLIPNARAGFFRARYPNWVVVDFRPERAPLRNLSRAIAHKLSPDSIETIETEIKRGFSSLIDLYKNSPWYINEADSAWQTADEHGKKLQKRKAANLLIIGDQFEEFFTNPENYSNGAPSEDSQIVVNLMLETARIALQNDLPIYVVCTMRSDYIGQCTAFRGLPEYIGFSQFFVPRLKRNELQQIIDEPARLNGNRISKRLTERLLYDLSDGFDQLPILQHALSQIWLAANHGEEEMDLVHYAIVGGMPADELQEKDQPRFSEWYNRLPDYQKLLYKHPGIEKIIEIHASKLYEDARTYFISSFPDQDISVKDVKKIIALTFACLTKIDDSRAVRNRMTLHEITQIINESHITADIVAGVVNIFREQGNSFLRPFITEDPESRKLSSTTVLDITHESLIRNWAQLKKWANKEYEFYSTFLDFQKQLQRWKEKKKSAGFLLPIGPLTYFEAWYQQCRPNKYWIDRYVGDPSQKEASLIRSEALLNDSREFLKTSAHKVIVTRTFMRYGANKIAAVLAIIAMLFLSSFYFIDARKKQNAYVVKELTAKSNALLASTEVESARKADYLIVQERHDPGSLLKYLPSVRSNEDRLSLAKKCYERILIYDKHFDTPIKLQLIAFIDQEVSALRENADPDFLLRSLNNYCVLLSYDFYYNNRPEIKQSLDANCAITFALVNEHLSGNRLFKISSISEVNMGIQLVLTFLNKSQDELKDIIKLLSPFEGNAEVANRFYSFYARQNFERNGRVNVSHNGGYHLLATLYASTGDSDKMKLCLDSLLFDIDYFKGRPFNHYSNVIGYLYQYNHRNLVGGTLSWISNHTGLSTEDLYEDLIDRSGFLKYLYALNINNALSESNAGYFHPNLCFISPATLTEIFDDYEKSIRTLPEASAINFKLALLYKMRAVFNHKYSSDRKIPFETDQLESWLEKSLEYFDHTDEKFLSGKVPVTYRYYGGGIRTKTLERRQLYIYPDLIDRYISNTYYSDLFFLFLKQHQKLQDLYKSEDDIQLFNYWISNYYEVYTLAEENAFKSDYPLPMEDLESVREFILGHPLSKAFDMNLINVILANYHFSQGDDEKGMRYYGDLNTDRLKVTSNMFDYLNKSFFYNQLKDLTIHLSARGLLKEAIDITEGFERPADRVHNYILIAEGLYEKNYSPDAFIFLDSAYSKMKSINVPSLRHAEDFRFTQLSLLGRINSESTNRMGLEVLKSLNELDKFEGITHRVEGIASSGNFYEAEEAIPNNLTETEELTCYTLILYEAARTDEDEQSQSAWNGMDKQFNQLFHYVFNFRG
ncbi:MAG TPA: ATP-binding protein [Cyclobacteriaceae bacterium]|nr:ATP-binding protein [Cyclobacteriaceae bacterium]